MVHETLTEWTLRRKELETDKPFKFFFFKREQRKEIVPDEVVGQTAVFQIGEIATYLYADGNDIAQKKITIMKIEGRTVEGYPWVGEKK